MKKLLKKGWFQILLLGVVFGFALIILDNRFGFFSDKKGKDGKYKGLVEGEKGEMYITTASYSEVKYDFGNVKEGDTVKHIFKVKNTGKAPLFIYKAAGTCDCIVPFVDKSEPLKPGEEREIMVAFLTKGRKGPQSRTVLVNTNTDPAEMVLNLTGVVE